ncbi:MAG: hypothetical protein ACO394_15715, partial [Blastocatellia bacterium]
MADEGMTIMPVKEKRERPRWETRVEKAIEVVIRLCGISAVLFVFGIFFFVVREGAGFLLAGKLSI